VAQWQTHREGYCSLFANNKPTMAKA